MSVFNQVWTDKDGRPFPAGLASIGPILPVEVCVPTPLAEHLKSQQQPIPSPVSGMALIDTGAGKSGVDDTVVTSLGVNPISPVQVETAGGQFQQFTYPGKLRFPTIGFEIEFSSMIGVNLSGQAVGNTNLIVLLGRDVLSSCLFVYNGLTASISLSL